MLRGVVAVTSVVVSLAVGSAGATAAPATPAASAGPASAVPLERLLIAVIDPPPGTTTDAITDDRLAAPLHLADPAAGTVVLRPGDPARTGGAFRVTLDPPATTLRVETAAGAPAGIELPTAADGHVTVVEVLGGPDGVVAHRIGDLEPAPDELRVPSWSIPAPGIDAAALDGAWWTLAPDVAAPDVSLPAAEAQQLRERLARTPVSGLRRLVDAAVGDVTGDGVADLALSFRRPFRRTLLNAPTPRRDWVDARGQSAHLGLFRLDDLSSIWVAGTLVRPIGRLAACFGALAVTYSTLRDPGAVSANALLWKGFGFLPLPELPGAGRPTCIDLDRDGRPDAAIVERS